MVWDSYEQQLYENGSQETVYFADLDSMTEQYDGLYCLNAQGKEQRLVLKGLPLTVGKLKGRVSVVLSDRSSAESMHGWRDTEEESVCAT